MTLLHSLGDTKCNFGLRRRNGHPAELWLELALRNLPGLPEVKIKKMKEPPIERTRGNSLMYA